MAATAGTVMGAALESAGYVAQNHVLTQLYPIIIALAVLFFVISVIRTIWSLLVDERAPLTLLKVVTPATILFILLFRVSATGVDWQYGEEEAERRRVVFEQTEFDVPTVEVSWLFHQFNVFVSGLVRELTDLLTQDRVRDQVLFMNRQRITGMVLSTELVSPGLKSLIAQGLQGQCGVWLSAARRIARGNRDPMFQGTPEYNAALVNYNALYSERVIKLPVGTPSYEYLTHLLPAIATAEIKGRNGEVLGVGGAAFADYYCDRSFDTTQGIEITNPTVLAGPVSCEQIWCWTTMGVFAEAESLINLSVDLTVTNQPTYKELPEERRKALLKEILQDIARKVSPPNDIHDASEEDPSILPIVIAGMFLRHELQKNPYAGNQPDFAESSGVRVSSYKPHAELDENEQRALRENVNAYERAFGYRTEILSAALSFPYFQGAILFVLSLLFPFFTLLLVLPGRASGFFMWCAAWVWVKSWDLGWAIVMTVDELLWDIMPHQAIYEPTTTGDHTPITILESAFDTDPTYTLVMYYTLISVLMFAVPTVLGQVILRSANGAADVLSERFQWLNTRAIKQLALSAGTERPTVAEIQEYQQYYYDRVLDGLPNRWDQSQRRSPAVLTSTGFRTDPHVIQNPNPPRQQPAIQNPDPNGRTPQRAIQDNQTAGGRTTFALENREDAAAEAIRLELREEKAVKRLPRGNAENESEVRDGVSE